MRETSISVNKRVYKILTSDKKLKEMVNGNIYPLVADESVKYPFVIFTKESANGEYSKDMLMYDNATLSVAIAANNYFQTVDIAERVRALLENHRDEYFLNILLDDVTEQYIEDAYVQELQFSAKIRIQ